MGGDTVNITQLDKVIRRFWQNENRNQIYYLGLCSEVAKALQKYLHGGKIIKKGLMHTALYYNGYYCDIRGCFTKRQFNVVAPSMYTRPANVNELNHINQLLDEDMVDYIVHGLKKAEREIL